MKSREERASSLFNQQTAQNMDNHEFEEIDLYDQVGCLQRFVVCCESCSIVLHFESVSHIDEAMCCSPRQSML